LRAAPDPPFPIRAFSRRIRGCDPAVATPSANIVVIGESLSQDFGIVERTSEKNFSSRKNGNYLLRDHRDRR
jgi:hypothetical protein